MAGEVAPVECAGLSLSLEGLPCVASVEGEADTVCSAVNVVGEGSERDGVVGVLASRCLHLDADVA